MKIGIDSFVDYTPDAGGNLVPAPQRMADLMEEIALADRVGLAAFGIGEHHRPDYLASSPSTILAAAAAVTKQIRLQSSVTVLSSDDPVRVFQQFATVDLISNGRAEIVVGRGSFTESYPLFGFDLKHYDELFAEKLDLLLKLREQANITWEGKHRSSLHGEGVYPRPVQQKLPVWLGVGGTPQSFARAGVLGLPLMVAIIGGEPHRFRPLIDLYRKIYLQAGHPEQDMKIGLHVLGFLADTDQRAGDTMFPVWQRQFSKIGAERGWGAPQTRAQFDGNTAPTGAFFVGSPDTVAAKLKYVNEALGGVDRVNIQLTSGTLPHQDVMHAIELLGSAADAATK
ncbi:LLM class flavin-dependent oxidoreductase [Terriglobus albidus]|uniref:LLM class flavin-dependent oxidoreductase n=1 Tax=Terriglobus albidus TaxID=1592106 RepID=UPI0021E064F3|nr:LLM class flavin-dependent oxidoreductase [Terriglobus albidus]